LKSKRIGIGSQITIHKSGDIIPTVDRVLSRSTEWNLPTDIDWQEDGKHIKTIQNTETQQSQKFILGLKLLQLDGIGPVISEKIGQIVEYDIIRLFDTNFKPDIKILLGSDSANWSRFEQFYNIKTIPLDQLIEMLQIDNCGKTLSRKFAEIMTGKQVDTKGMNKQLLKDVCSSGGKYNTIVKESMNKLKQYGIKVIKPIEVSEDSFSFEMSGDPGE
jgi:NAD-dependent DNA ligase